MRYIIDGNNPVNLDHPLNRGLVSWWKVLPFWRGGNTWRDLCRHNGAFDGTLTNMTAGDWLGDSPLGGFGSLDFGATNDYVQLGQQHKLALIAATSTYAYWVKTTDTSTQPTIYSFINAAGQLLLLGFNRWYNGTSFVNDTGAVAIQVRDEDNNDLDAVAESSTLDALGIDVLDGAWHHIAISFDGANNTVSFVIDGKTVTTSYGRQETPDNFANLDYNVTLATHENRNSPGTTDNWDGQMSEFRVYERVLSATEMQQLYSLSLQQFSPLLNWIDLKVTGEATAAPAAGPNLLTLVGVG